RALHRHAGVARDARKFVLLGAAFGTGLGEAGREDHDAADPARGAALHRVEHAGTWNRQHRAVDAVGQIGGGFQTRSSIDLRAIGIDQMDLAGEAEAFEIGENAAAERTWRWRGARNGNGARPEDACDRGLGGTGHWRKSPWGLVQKGGWFL